MQFVTFWNAGTIIFSIPDVPLAVMTKCRQCGKYIHGTLNVGEHRRWRWHAWVTEEMAVPHKLCISILWGINMDKAVRDV